MTIRLQEVHPAVVHFPIALLPTALAADAIGRWTESEALMAGAKRLMPIAAASAAVAGAAGLAAQPAVRAEGKAHDLLVTHRNLNAGLVVLVGAMAAVRMRREKPGLGYLLAGLAGLATMTYTAMIGGRMVYKHGLGVEPAGTLREERAPEVDTGNAGEAARVAVDNAADASKHAASHVGKGEIAPALSSQ